MRKKLPSLLLTFCMICALLPLTTPKTAAAQLTMPAPTPATSSYVGYARVLLIDASGQLWAYNAQKRDQNDEMYDFQKELVAKNVAQIAGENAYVTTGGTLYSINWDDLSAPLKVADNVVKADMFSYLTRQGDYYSYDVLREFGASPTVTRDLNASDVIDYSGSSYITADHVLHYWDTYWNSRETFSEKPMSRIIEVGALDFFLSTDGTLYGTGNNACGMVGNGGGYDRPNSVYSCDTLPVEQELPVGLLVTSPSFVMNNVETVWGMDDAMYARDRNGQCWTWGDSTQEARIIYHAVKPGQSGDIYDYEGNAYTYDLVNAPEGKTYASPRKTSAAPAPALANGLRQDTNGNIYAGKYLVPHTGGILGDNTTVTEKPTVGRFTDVAESAYYAEPVKWAVENEFTAGTTATTFSPNQTCTRGQIITFLWRAAGSPEPKNATPFSDVNADAYYAKATVWAAEQGIEKGSAFSPNAPCTRLMAVEFMWKYADSPKAPEAVFTDVASGAVNWAVKQGVTSGTSSMTFSPEQTCTRAQIMTFLYRGFAE